MNITASQVRKNLSETCLSEAAALAILEGFAGPAINESINDRAAVKAQLDALALADGSVWVQRWSRDCDGVEGLDTYRIHASLLSYGLEYRRIAESAEGPFSLTIVGSEGIRGTVGHGWGIN